MYILPEIHVPGPTGLQQRQAVSSTPTTSISTTSTAAASSSLTTSSSISTTSVPPLQSATTSVPALPTNGTSPGTQSSTSSGSMNLAIPIVVSLIVAGTLAVVGYSCIRRLRLADKKPKYLPGAFLKRKWNEWKPSNRYTSVGNDADGGSIHETEELTTATPRPRPVTQANLDHRTSVRSILTLPPYSFQPQDSEQIIGREGERGGMDTVIEFPETNNEEEARREEEMESLYQIRLQRRQEIADREERRRQRREAREAGDYARLEELRLESRRRREERADASSNILTAEAMIAEHNARPRDRRVSEVTYTGLGNVRHDGSRLRAHSRGNEDERGGLLSGAAPMGASHRHGRQASDAPTMGSMNELTIPSLGRARANSAATSISSVDSSFEDLSNAVTQHTISQGSTVTRSLSGAHVETRPDNEDHMEADAAATEAGVDISSQLIIPTELPPGFSPTGPPRYSTIEWPDAPHYEDLSRRGSLASHNRDSRRLSGLQAPRLPSMNLETLAVNLQPPTQPNSPAVARGDRIDEEDESDTDSDRQHHGINT